MRQFAVAHQFRHNRRNTACVKIVFAQILARRLKIDQQRYIVTYFLPVVVCQLNAKVTGNSVEMDRSVRGPTNRRIDNDRILKGFPGHDVGGLLVGMNHVDNAFAGFVCGLSSFPVRRRNGCGTRKLHSEGFSQRVHC